MGPESNVAHWIDWLARDPEAQRTFEEMLDRLDRAAHRRLDAATTMDEVAAARAQRIFVDHLRQSITLHHQEESAYARFRHVVGA